MNFSNYIATRILGENYSSKNISTPIVKIGTVGIALGVAVMIITIAVITGFQNQITKKVVSFTSHMQINDYNKNQSLEPNPITLNDTLLDKISEINGIKHVQVFATKNGILKTKTDNEGVVLKGVDEHFDWTNLAEYVTDGKTLTINKDSVSKNIFISKTLAQKLNLTLNQKILMYFMTKKKLTDTTLLGSNYINYEPRVRDFYIKGIFNSGFAEFDKNLVLVDIKQIQTLNYWNNKQVAGYEVFVNDFNKLNETTDLVNDLVGYNYTVVNTKKLQANIFGWLDMIDVNAIIIITLMVLVAGINMISALLILILEKTSMVGVLKALGLPNSQVRKIFIYVSLKLLFKGLFIGNIIGVGICMLQYYFNFATLNPETYYLSYVPINLTLRHVVLINIGTVASCIIMMLIPTLILNKITPIKAIRFS